MADKRSRDRPGAGEPPWEVEITVLPGPRSPLREQMAHLDAAGRVRWAAAILLAGAALGTIAVLGVGAASSPRPATGARARGPAGVAAAYGYPPGCLSISVAPGNPAYARADFSHSTLCGRFGGDPTAVFHRVGGAWRPVLDAVAYTCPVASLPARVQAELGVCAMHP